LRPVLGGFKRRTSAILSLAVLAVLLGGCGSLSGALRGESALLATEPAPRPDADAIAAAPDPASPVAGATVEVSGARQLATEELAPSVTRPPVIVAASKPEATGDGEEGAQPALAQTQRAPQEKIPTRNDEVEEEYDPWEPFNETMFEFNRKLDQYILKPVAKGYNTVMPEPWQVLVANGFDNIRFLPRAVNSLLQGKWGGAGREMSRFLINSTLGIGGLFDAAKYWGIEKSKEDFGQTLAVWGAKPGPYLILPFLEPLTVRDGIGKAVDGALDPLSYVLPFIWTRLGMTVGDTVNDRSLNLDLFQGFEESVIDMYSAERHGYLRRREQLIKE
jgi:phospholipid-binding lipoprotein MlaA